VRCGMPSKRTGDPKGEEAVVGVVVGDPTGLEVRRGRTRVARSVEQQGVEI